MSVRYNETVNGAATLTAGTQMPRGLARHQFTLGGTTGSATVEVDGGGGFILWKTLDLTVQKDRMFVFEAELDALRVTTPAAMNVCYRATEV